MKQLATILSVASLVLCGVLFYLFAHHTEQLKSISAIEQRKGTPDHFRIAYFDLDTLQANYDYFKEAMTKLKAQENDMNMRLASLNRSYQKKVDAWRQKSNTMTQAEAEQAQQEYAGDQQNFQNQKQQLESELYKNTEDYKSQIRKKVEDFLKRFNSRGEYSFIFAYDPGSFIYNKDTIYDITSVLVNGLNAEYATDKKKK
ncbi:MAG TPA: OmpH family outer membrane protein [Puia sp.]|jgi:outer membrane protein|nr:OmpH family outer membrane protein [Puia sp.]